MLATLRSILWVLPVVVIIALVGCDKPGPSGTYEAKAPAGQEGGMTLEFQKDSKVKLLLTAPMGKMEFTCDYKVEGDKVIIQPPEGAPTGDVLTLVRKGDGYEATDGGETMMFVKK